MKPKRERDPSGEILDSYAAGLGLAMELQPAQEQEAKTVLVTVRHAVEVSHIDVVTRMLPHLGKSYRFKRHLLKHDLPVRTYDEPAPGHEDEGAQLREPEPNVLAAMERGLNEMASAARELSSSTMGLLSEVRRQHAMLSEAMERARAELGAAPPWVSALTSKGDEP